jgi:hypothetical protein
MHVEGFCDIPLPIRHVRFRPKVTYRFLAYTPGTSRNTSSFVSKKRCLNYTSWVIKTHLVHKYHAISSGNPCTLRKWCNETLVWQINLYFIHPVGELPHESSFLTYLWTTIWPKLKPQSLDFNRPGTILYYEFLHSEYVFCSCRLACRHIGRPKELTLTAWKR